MRDLGLIHERKRRPKGLTKATTEAPVPNPHLPCDERRGQDDHIPVCIHLLQHCPDPYIQSRRTSSGSIPDDLATRRTGGIGCLMKFGGLQDYTNIDISRWWCALTPSLKPCFGAQKAVLPFAHQLYNHTKSTNTGKYGAYSINWGWAGSRPLTTLTELG